MGGRKRLNVPRSSGKKRKRDAAMVAAELPERKLNDSFPRPQKKKKGREG